VSAAAASPETAVPALPDVDSLEARIGSRWLLYVGVGAIVVATSSFLKLAFESRWITETMRIVFGAVGGLALVWIGGRFVRSGLAVYGQMLIGGGIAILYVAIYAAFNFYALVSQPVAIVLMVAVTGLAAVEADRHRSQGLAVMAVGGGFLTPFLVGGRTNAQVALFGYDAVLVAGTAALARRRDWPVLNLVSYTLTIITVGGWLAAHYSNDAYLRTVLFLTLFCALYGYILAQHAGETGRLARATRRLLATAPLLYYVVSVTLLYRHSMALLLFLILVTLTGVVFARRLRSAWGPVVVWVAVVLPLLAWVDARADASWLLPGGTAILAVCALQLVAQLDRLRHDPGGLDPAGIVLFHLNALGTYVLLHGLFNPWHVDWLAPIAALMALGYFALWAAGRRWHTELPDHALGPVAALGAVALTLWMNGAPGVVGWAVEATVLTSLGVRSGREWLRLSGAALVGLSAIRLLGLLFGAIDAHYVVLINVRAATTLVVVLLLASLAWLHRRQGVVRLTRDAEYFTLAAHLLVLVLATTEINAFFELRGAGRSAVMARVATLVIAWTLQGVALVRAGLSRRSERLRLAGGLVLVLAIAWPFDGHLPLLTSLWETALLNAGPPAGYLVFANARAASALVSIVALYGVARMHRRTSDAGRATATAATLLASFLVLALLSAETSAFWRLRERAGLGTFEFARQMSLSIVWAACAAAFIAIGIRRRYRPIRYFAIVLFLVTILKVVAVDLSELERLYRVLSIAGLGLLLLVASYLYQRFRERLAAEPAGDAPVASPPGPSV